MPTQKVLAGADRRSRRVSGSWHPHCACARCCDAERPGGQQILPHAGERTFVQDPAFGFRQLVDIAIRALSPAVNDPTTAVQAIDRISDLLAISGTRPDPTGLRVDSEGAVRVKQKLRNFDGLLVLALTEIIRYGAGAPQVVRRSAAAARHASVQARMCPRVAPPPHLWRFAAGQGHRWRASRPVGRVLCTRVSGPTAIHLGLPLPAASCGLPASIGRAALKRSRRKRTPTVPLPSWPCSGWGLPSRPGRPGRWWSLTPPFHPYLPGPASGRTGAAVCFLWHCPAGHPGSVLPTTLPCGARTFLTAHRAARPPGRLARHRKDMLPRPAEHDRRRFSPSCCGLES